MKENVKDYLFLKKEELFLNEEKKLVERENIKRKEKMKINFDEINEFEKNVLTLQQKTKTEQNERKKKLILEWKERKNSLPIYTLNLNKLSKEEINDEINEDKKKEIITPRDKQNKMKLFAYDIKNNKQPEINAKLKNERMLLIKSIENPKMTVKLSHKLLFQKNKKLFDDSNKQINNKDNLVIKDLKLNNSLSPKRIKRRLFPLHPKSKVKIDYLTEIIKEKNKKNLSNEKEKDFDEDFNKAKWNKEIKDKAGTVIENINFVKEKTKLMDKIIKQKEQYLKLTGGVENSPEVGQEMSQLIIDSIGAKLSILNICK